MHVGVALVQWPHGAGAVQCPCIPVHSACDAVRCCAHHLPVCWGRAVVGCLKQQPCPRPPPPVAGVGVPPGQQHDALGWLILASTPPPFLALPPGRNLPSLSRVAIARPVSAPASPGVGGQDQCPPSCHLPRVTPSVPPPPKHIPHGSRSCPCLRPCQAHPVRHGPARGPPTMHGGGGGRSRRH